MSVTSRILLGIAAVLLAAAAVKHLREPLVPPGPRDAEPPPVCNGIAAEEPPSVWLAELTWTEVCAAIAAGHRTAIVPTGGIEQNGPHLVLGKHGFVLRATAERIARELGDALVAPVVEYVPEGRIDPPEGHMEWAGTLSVPEPVFEAVLESAARSLRQHGFTRIAFVGDSGDSQDSQARVAARLASEWGGGALHVSAYYFENGQTEWLLQQGETEAAIGTHAGIRDTSEMLAAHPTGVRTERLRADAPPASGVEGDPTRASAARGEEMLRRKVAAAVRQIRAGR